MNNDNSFVYDLECYPNFFSFYTEHAWTDECYYFEISPFRNDIQQLMQFVQYVNGLSGRMVGFNNEYYDYPLLHHILTQSDGMNDSIYQKSDSIINSDDRFGHLIWESDRLVPQVDLFKIHHFDNIARSTSLKVLEFNMRSDTIEDLPVAPGTILTLQQMELMYPYNVKDVKDTKKFYHKSLPAIEFRDGLTAKYNRNFINYNDTKIGAEYFIMQLEHEGIPCYDKSKGSKKPRQTWRESINLNDAVFPYIYFNRPEFKMVKDWLGTKIIKRTKGVFEYIDVPREMATVMRPELIKVYGLTADDLPNTESKFKKRLGDGILLSRCKDPLPDRPLSFVSGWKDKSGLNCIVNNFAFDFGTGGIHGSVDSMIVRSDDDYIILDLDVASYYPNVAIRNRVYPAHLSEQFCDIYQDMFEQRRHFKKGTPENAMLKLALNGVYGKSNSVYSPFYDPLFTMKITINGQLLLCMLAEHLMDGILGLTMIQINTDGLTVKLPRAHVGHLRTIAKWWEEFTLLELEEVEYKAMYIRDVNNYIGEYTDGKLKRKGAYCYGDDLDWSQNHSSQIIAKAAEAALVRGEDIRTFITNHMDLHDFMLRAKIPRNSKLTVGNRQVQNTTRYYITGTGDSMVKLMPPTPSQLAKDPNAPERKFGIDVGWLVTECNDIRNATVPINYEYYITEAEKLVNPLKTI